MLRNGTRATVAAAVSAATSTTPHRCTAIGYSTSSVLRALVSRPNQAMLPSTTLRLAAARSMSSIVRAAPTWLKKPPSPDPSGGEILLNLTNENPYKDAVRFDWKNQKYTYKALNFNSVALATGFLETGLQPGDVCLSWLPLHFAEHVMLQFACSKAGLILYWLDPALAITNPDQARLALHNALHVCKANVLVTQEAGSDVNYMRLCERVIPETRFFHYGEGYPFVTPRFPHLRLTIHTGFDCEDKEGFLLIRDMLVPAEGLLESLSYPFTIDADTPLMGRFVLDKDGLPIGVEEPLTNKQVLDQKEWPIYASVLRKEYINVPGKGVVF